MHFFREENVSKFSTILRPSVDAVSCSSSEKQDESIAFKDVFRKENSKTVQLMLRCLRKINILSYCCCK